MAMPNKISRETCGTTLITIILIALIFIVVYRPFINVTENVTALFLSLGALYGGSLMWISYNTFNSKGQMAVIAIISALSFFLIIIYQNTKFPDLDSLYLLFISGLGAIVGINIVSIIWAITERK
jgi:CDP-diglyceride synthetase